MFGDHCKTLHLISPEIQPTNEETKFLKSKINQPQKPTAQIHHKTPQIKPPQFVRPSIY